MTEELCTHYGVLVDRAHLNAYTGSMQSLNTKESLQVQHMVERWRPDTRYGYLLILANVEAPAALTLIGNNNFRPALERTFYSLTGSDCHWSLMLDDRNMQIFNDTLRADRDAEIVTDGSIRNRDPYFVADWFR
jgi:hypothetical protein